MQQVLRDEEFISLLGNQFFLGNKREIVSDPGFRFGEACTIDAEENQFTMPYPLGTNRLLLGEAINTRLNMKTDY